MNYPMLYSKTKSLFVVTLLLTSIFIGLIAIAPAAVQAAAPTIETSADAWGKFYGAALVRVLIYDPSLAGDEYFGNEGSVIDVEVYVNGVKNATTLKVDEHRDTGYFEFFARADVADNWLPSSPLDDDTGELDNTTTALWQWGSGCANRSATYTLSKDDEIKFEYTRGGYSVSTTLEYDYTTATISLDRSDVGPNATVRVYVEDPDLNLDPTAADDNTVYDTNGVSIPATLYVEVKNTTGFLFEGILNATGNNVLKESEVNSAYMRNTTLTVEQIIDTASSISPNIYWNGSIVAGNISEVKLIYWDPVRPKNETYTTFTVTATKGKITAPTALTELRYHDNLKDIIIVSDAAENVKTTAKDSLVLDIDGPRGNMSDPEGNYLLNATDKADPSARLNITLSGSLYVLSMKNSTHWVDYVVKNMTETDKNTGEFKPNGDIYLTYDTGKIGTGDDYLYVDPDYDIALIYFDPGRKYNKTTSKVIIPITTELASISTDSPTYKKGADVKITVVDLDLNDNPDSRETVSNTTDGATYVKLAVGGTYVGKLTVKVNDTATAITSGTVVSFGETDVNTGTFTYTLDMDDLTYVPEDGDTVKITWYDVFDADSVSVSVTVGVTTGTVTLDRTSYPIARGETVYVKVTVEDSDANLDSRTAEVITGTTSNYIKGWVKDVTSYIDFRLTETDINTGIFTGWLQIPIPAACESYIRQQIEVAYYDYTAAKFKNATAKLVPHTAALSVNNSRPNMGDYIELKLTEPDMNLKSTTKQSVTIASKKDETATESFTLKETDVNTGIFTKVIQIGEDITFGQTDLGKTITFNYTDTVDAASSSTALSRTNVELEVYVVPHTATLSLDKDTYAPYSKVVVTLYDPDLTLEKKADVKLKLIKTVELGKKTENLAANESLGDGKFTFEIWLNGTETGLGTGPDSEPIDELYIYYVDEANAEGKDETVSVHAPIRSVTGELSLDKTAYLVGEWVEVTLKDADRNEDPDSLDSVTVTVYSDSWPIGQDVILTETGVNTGEFYEEVLLVDEIPTGNQIWVTTGETITIKYKDPYDATGEVLKYVTATAKVGVEIEYPVPASAPELVDTAGQPIEAPAAGQLLIVQSSITNEDATARDFVFLVQIKDEAGVIVHIAFISGSLAAGQTMTPGVSWVPEAAGTYSAEVYVWKSLAVPEPLSLVQTLTITVG